MFGNGFGTVLMSAMSLSLAACVTSEAIEAEPELSPSVSPDQQAFLDTCESWDDWDKPAPPFKVHGNTYYVGTCGISAILITGDREHILIDSGTEAGAEVILRNIKSLGFNPKDIVFLLYSHEHFDHVGGHAIIKAATGASVIANNISRPVFQTGIVSSDDPQFGTHDPMTPVEPDLMLEDVSEVRTDTLLLKAIHTPGHSPGALSWAWQTCEERCENIVYADSLSPVSRNDYKFSDHTQYLAKYRAGLAWLSQFSVTECSLLLTPHPSHSQMLKRMKAGKLVQNAPGDKPCADYAEGKLEDIDKRLLKEQAETP